MQGEELAKLRPLTLGYHEGGWLGQRGTVWLSEQPALPVCPSDAQADKVGISRLVA